MDKKPITLTGKVCSGLGEGAVFLRMPYYANAFESILKKPAFPGTLNINVTSLPVLPEESRKFIPGFLKGEKEFAGVHYWHVHISSVKHGQDITKEADCLLIKPVKTKHLDTMVEVVSSRHLRKDLDLEDGDEVKISLY